MMKKTISVVADPV